MSEINEKLLNIAIAMLHQGYTVENKGEYEKMKENTISPFTPGNLKKVYDELTGLFITQE